MFGETTIFYVKIWFIIHLKQPFISMDGHQVPGTDDNVQCSERCICTDQHMTSKRVLLKMLACSHAQPPHVWHDDIHTVWMGDLRIQYGVSFLSH